MKHDVPIKNGIVIPEHELEITTSRAGGPGGQHVNKTNTRITVRWNVKNTQTLSEEQKNHVLERLKSRLTTEGDLIIHNNTSRSQHHNKTMALLQLAKEVNKALHVPKKRTATTISRAGKESRLHAKNQRSAIKKLRSKKINNDT
jgi:ribosome-associated protein